MKSILIIGLLALSLVANGILLVRRLSPPSPGARTGGGRTTASTGAASAGTITVVDAKQLLSEQLTKLRASGMESALVRTWITAEVDELFHDREMALRSPRQEKYWQPTPEVPLATKLARIDLQNEKSSLLDDLLGYDPTLPENAIYDHLPPEKQAAVKRVFEEYAAKLVAYRESTAGMATTAEEGEIARLETARRQALAPWLTDAEQTQLLVRYDIARWPPPPPDAFGAVANPSTRPMAAKLQKSLRYFDSTAEEFTSITQVQSEFQPLRQYSALETAVINAQEGARLREALGDERYGLYLKSANSDYADLADLVGRMGLPVSRAADVMALQERVLAESARIDAAASLDSTQKRAALTDFTRTERARIESLIGPAGAEAATRYLARWLQPLDEGKVLVPMPGKGLMLIKSVGGPSPVVRPQ